MYEWVSMGKVPVVKVGKLDKWLEGQRKGLDKREFLLKKSKVKLLFELESIILLHCNGCIYEGK